MSYNTTYTSQTIIQAIQRCPLSMMGAAKLANMPYGTFINRAKKLGIYNPNPGHTGVPQTSPKQIAAIKNRTTDLDEILAGLHPTYPTVNLKQRLFKEGIKHESCEQCGQLPMHHGKRLVLQLDHIDGNSINHKYDNIQILCPNCHTQTDTYAGKNKKNISKWKHVSDLQFINAYKTTGTVTNAIKSLGLNYQNNTLFKHVKTIIVPFIDDYYIHNRPKSSPIRIVYHPVFTKDELQSKLWDQPIIHMAKQYNMSGSALGRWVKKWKLDQPPRGYFLRGSN